MEGSKMSGGVLKKKSSSGCLIIKKKVDNRNSGGGLGSSSIQSKDKKRPRLLPSDSAASGEDESLEFMRRKVNDKRLHNGSMGYKKSENEYRECDRINVGMDISRKRKRSRTDLYEFDEYDEFDGKRMRNEYVEDSFKMVGHNSGGNLRELGVGSSYRNLMVNKRNQVPYFDGASIGRSKGVEYANFMNNGLELEEAEAHMRTSLLRLKHQEMSDEPIRLQGKNGVLKVMVNKKKRLDLHSHHQKYDPREVVERAGYRQEDFLKKDLLVRSPVYSAPKPQERDNIFGDKDKSIEKEKMVVKLEKVKPILNKGIKARASENDCTSTGISTRELETDATDTALKLAPPVQQACSSKKGIKIEEERMPSLENITPVKGKEGKAKRGGSTEKQMLREKIRGMLVDAGWSIDYRPRRNRDYLDAVYINPNGTAYWSIIKAYDALKKQLEEDKIKIKSDVGSPSFAPLSEDLINKLTRQTKKKIEEEMKRKRKDDGVTKSIKGSTVKDSGDSSDSDQNEERLSSYMKQSNKSRRGKLLEVDQEIGDDTSDDLPKGKPEKVRVEKTSIASNSNVVQGRTSKVIGRCTLLVRGSDRGENSESDGYVPYNGKRTVLAWLIDSGAAKLSEKVQYMNRKRTRVMLEGWITKDGIHCGCCSKILTVSKFELHAGSKLRQPYQNIILESGISLLQCQIDAWNRQGESVCRDFHTVDVDGDDPDDDTCGICGDGGVLICCDSCPSTFHLICLEMKMLPSGDWHCPNCTCKFCGDASGSFAEENDTTAFALIGCSFCEKKYRKSCSERLYALPLSSDRVTFCGLKCQELYDHFQKILGVKHELEGGFSWSLLQRTDVSDTSHRGFPQRVESNSKLAVALSVMDECFLPIIDRRSGINIIQNVVYNCGSNFNRLNYCGFYTAILERGDEIVSAASIRIHGTCLAEMPFIGTREIYRRQGMCRRLLSAIETELCSLKVELLIIPAISEHLNTWTKVFGFHQLDNLLKKEMKSMNMLVFPGTDMLQKELGKPETSDGMNLSESIKNQPRLPILVEKPDPVDSGSPRLAIPSNDNSAASASDSVCESTILPARKGKTLVVSRQKEIPSTKDSANSTGRNLICDTHKIEAHSSMEASPDRKVASDVDANVICTKKNIAISGAQLASSSSVEVSAEDAAETINENQNSVKTDKPDGERKIPHASHISSSESMAHDTTTAEDHKI